MSLQRAEASATVPEAHEGSCHESSFSRTGNEACPWPNMLPLFSDLVLFLTLWPLGGACWEKGRWGRGH